MLEMLDYVLNLFDPVLQTLKGLPQPFYTLIGILWLVVFLLAAFIAVLFGTVFGVVFQVLGAGNGIYTTLASIFFHLTVFAAVFGPILMAATGIWSHIIEARAHPNAKLLRRFLAQLKKEDSRFTDQLQPDFGDYLKSIYGHDIKADSWRWLVYDEFKDHFDDFLAGRT